MSAAVTASFAAELDLPDGYVVQWSAIDPTTGADVAGVVIRNVSLFGTLLDTSTGSSITVGPFMLVPGPGA